MCWTLYTYGRFHDNADRPWISIKLSALQNDWNCRNCNLNSKFSYKWKQTPVKTTSKIDDQSTERLIKWVLLMVGTFVLAKGEVHRPTRLYYISTKHSPDRVVEQCFGIHISHPWTVWLEICCDEELPTQKNKLSFPILDIRKSLKYHFPDDRW